MISYALKLVRIPSKLYVSRSYRHPSTELRFAAVLPVYERPRISGLYLHPVAHLFVSLACSLQPCLLTVPG